MSEAQLAVVIGAGDGGAAAASRGLLLLATSSQQPAASSQQPAASSQQPAASSQQPAASSQQQQGGEEKARAQTWPYPSYTTRFPNWHPTKKVPNHATFANLHVGKLLVSTMHSRMPLGTVTSWGMVCPMDVVRIRNLGTRWSDT